MKKQTMKILMSISLGLLIMAASMSAVQANLFGSILKVGGVAFLVDQYKKPINNFINKALGERGAQAMGATKVVPILSIGSGGYIGAAQVVGVPSAVQKTQAVVQIEISAGSFRATGIVPVSRKTVSGSPERMKGVGVSAVVDFKI
jgi:hypothetical protein